MTYLGREATSGSIPHQDAPSRARQSGGVHMLPDAKKGKKGRSRALRAISGGRGVGLPTDRLQL